jgi:hypothetical protein
MFLFNDLFKIKKQAFDLLTERSKVSKQEKIAAIRISSN